MEKWQHNKPVELTERVRKGYPGGSSIPHWETLSPKTL